MADPTLTERARAVLATLDDDERFIVSERGDGRAVRLNGWIPAFASVPAKGLTNDTRTELTDLGREVARLLAEEVSDG